jgi:hypothetical protein
MTTTEQPTETISDVQKSNDVSVTTLLAELVRKQDSRIDSFEKRFDNLETLIKEANANPVDSGIEAENKPKTEDAKDVGDKVTIGNEYAPEPSNAQASIIAPAVNTSGTDNSGLQMENKMDDDKEEDKKEIDKEDDKEEDDKKDIEKSDSEYEIVKTVRPAGIKTDQVTAPTGYQILKAIIGGWNGKTNSVEESMNIAYNKLNRGEFGTGWSQGGTY